MNPVALYFSKISPNAIIPSKRQEDAGYDIYACFTEPYILIEPHQVRSIPTGIASACSPDYYFQLAERGSTGTKNIGQRCGVIDSGYRGEWFVPLTNHSNTPLYIVKSYYKEKLITSLHNSEYILYPAEKAICQMLVLPVPQTSIIELPYDKLSLIESDRKDGKLGSSSK